MLSSLSKYPARYGKLSGLFLNLLDEISAQTDFPADRVEYYKSRIKSIDTNIPAGYDGPHANKLHKETKAP